MRFERLRLGRRRLQFVPNRHGHFRFHDVYCPVVGSTLLPGPARRRARSAADWRPRSMRLVGSCCRGRCGAGGRLRRRRRDRNSQIARQLIPSRGRAGRRGVRHGLGRRSECGWRRRGRLCRLLLGTPASGVSAAGGCRLGLFRSRFRSKVARQGGPMVRLLWFGHNWFGDNSPGKWGGVLFLAPRRIQRAKHGR